MNFECLFCKKDRFALNKHLNLPAEQSIIYEDKNIYVTPDLFPLVKGHFLIITKEHYCCYGQAPKEIIDSVKIAYHFIENSIFKDHINILSFEHGTAFEEIGGSSINHAHLHVLPIKFDMIPYIKNSEYINTEPQTISFEKLGKLYETKTPYLFVKNSIENSIVFEVKNQIPSQFLRMIIGNALKVPYDWKCEQNIDHYKQLFLKTMDYQ